MSTFTDTIRRPHVSGVLAGVAVVAAATWRAWPVTLPPDRADARELMAEFRDRNLTAEENRQVAQEYGRMAAETVAVTHRGYRVVNALRDMGQFHLDLARGLQPQPARPAVPRPQGAPA